MVKTKHRGIYKRGSRYVITYQDRRGKQRKESAGKLNLKEARALKAKREAEVRGGRDVDGQRVLFHEFAHEWMKNFSGTTVQLRSRTIKDYRQQMKRYPLEFFPKKQRIAEITPGDIDDLVTWMMRKTETRKAVSSATVRRVLVPLRLCFEQARRKEIILANPADRASVPKEQPKEKSTKAKAMTRTELKSLLAQIPDDHKLFFRAVASTGARWSEAAAWKKKDLDTENLVLKVRRSLQDGTEEAPKSKESRRSIPISKTLCRHLKAEVQGLGDSDYIFSKGDGLPLDYFEMRRRVLDPAARESDLDWVGFHTFRHTAASILFENGSNIKEVQEFLGHSTPEFTLNTYVHLIGEGTRPFLDLDEEIGS